MNRFSNGKLYREMLVPHPSQEAANAAVQTFYALLRTARKDCVLANVSVVVESRFTGPDGEDHSQLYTMHVGSADLQVNMLAAAIGDARTSALDTMLALMTPRQEREQEGDE